MNTDTRHADARHADARHGALAIRSVGKTWLGKDGIPMVALRDVDLDIAPGEFVVLLGPSGCGKSTLLSMIAGLAFPSVGAIHCDGRQVTGPGTDRGMIFQESALFPWLNIGANVAFGLSLAGMPAQERRQRAQALLREVGLAEAIDKRPDELSGGMRQRAACARALAMSPRVLLMDEPFAALDVQTRARMQEFLMQIWRRSGASVVLVTHSIDEAIALADRVVVFTARPGTVKSIVPIELPRPRPTRGSQYHELHDQFTELLADEVDRAFAQQQS